jgi:histidinol-phosphate aminotransferase
MAELEPYRTQQHRADVRIQANEWPEPNPAGRYLAVDELDHLLLNRYPGHGDELRSVLSERWRVRPEQLILGNGSNEVLLGVFLVFGGHGRRTLLFQPTYSMHARLSVIAGGEAQSEMIGLPYDLRKDRALEAMGRVRPEVVVFTSPNNPTGNVIDEQVILAVAETYPESVVLVDEAYADFAGTTLVPQIAHNPNLIVSKTFSKVRAAAGLRVGVLVVHPELVRFFNAAQLPYNMSALTLAVAVRIARDDVSVERRLALVASERGRVYDALRGVAAIEAFPSVANFVLFRLSEGSPAEVHARFLKQSVLIRDVSNWPGCERCLRASIGTAEENDRFIAALPTVFGPSSARR